MTTKRALSTKKIRSVIRSAMRRALAKKSSQHIISFDHHDRPLVPCCTRAHCTCGWCSDSYASFHDAQRAADVHLRRSERTEPIARRIEHQRHKHHWSA